MDVRQEILEKASHLFAEQGFDGTSVQEIADAVGIRKPSLLYHFESKDTLREQVLDQMLSRWNEVLPALVIKASNEERFDAIMTALCTFFTDDAGRARLILRETLDRPDDIKKRLLQFVRPWIDVISDQLERAKKAGTVRPEVDTQAYAVHVVNMVVAGVAVLEALSVVLPRKNSQSTKDRYINELLRITRTSLYTE